MRINKRMPEVTTILMHGGNRSFCAVIARILPAKEGMTDSVLPVHAATEPDCCCRTAVVCQKQLVKG